jgi:hypothetical protein
MQTHFLKEKTMRKISIVLSAFLLAVPAACVTAPSPIKIKPVTPVSSLPSLPQRNTVTIKTYLEAFTHAKDVKSRIDQLGGQIDIGVHDEYLDCQQYFDLYQQAMALPILETSESDPLLTWAVNEHSTAIDHLLETARDTYNHCEAFLLGQATTTEVAPLSWTLARLGVAESATKLETIIKRMGQELPDTTVYIGVGGQILEASREAMEYMGNLGYEIDKRLVSCPRFIENYENVIALPEFDVATTDPVVQEAYSKYRWAIEEVARTSHDQYLDCQDLLTTGLESRLIPRLTWTTSRKGIADAMATLHQVEQWLKDYAK